MTHRGKVGYIVETRRNRREFSFEWQINDFFSMTGERGDRYASPDVHFCNAVWSLGMHPNGTLQSSTLGWVTLFLFRNDKGSSKTFNVTVGIRGTEGVENKREKGQEFSENDRACCWFAFHSISELRKHESRLVPDNILIITCDMKNVVFPFVRVLSSYQDVCSQTDDEFRELNILKDACSQTEREFKKVEDIKEENKSSAKLGIEKAMEDFGKLLVSGENSDITVQVKDIEFKAHRAILSVRSPVLYAMFKHETAEKVFQRITICDCEPDVFEDFLHYLYTGSIQHLSKQNFFGLYQVADKYLVDDLKQQCLEQIQEMLCVQTFCDTVKLALAHEESDMLKLALNFAAENIQLIICSIEWQNFICEYPREANEILIKSICPQSQKSIDDE